MSPVRKSSSEIADELDHIGFSICENFVSQSDTLATRSDIARLKSEGRFHRAGVGHGAGFEVRDSVRRDEIHWLERETSNATQDVLWVELESLKMAFNRKLFLGLGKFEGHYATFEKGGFYQRHLDSFGDTNLEGKTRVVSLVLYLNENWLPADGGQLRIYTQNSFIDVAPVGGTLVCFMSRESEHEVLPSHAKRTSFTGWFSR